MFFRIFTTICALATMFFAAQIILGIHEREKSKAEMAETAQDAEAFIEVEDPVEEVSAENPVEEVHYHTRRKFNDVHHLLLARTHQKKEIYLETLRPELDTAGIIIVSVFHEVMGDDYTPWITSGNDYEHHKKTSAHYRNMALDFRLKGIPMYKKRLITQKAKSTLGRRFFVQHEFPGGVMEHLHIELRDPKRTWAY